MAAQRQVNIDPGESHYWKHETIPIMNEGCIVFCRDHHCFRAISGPNGNNVVTDKSSMKFLGVNKNPHSLSELSSSQMSFGVWTNDSDYEILDYEEQQANYEKEKAVR